MQQVTRRHVLLSAGALASASLFHPLQSLASPWTETLDASTWDLTPLYANSADWETSRLALKKDLLALKKHQTTFGSSGSALVAVYQEASDVSRAAQRLLTYAQLSADADLNEPSKQERRRQALSLQDELSEAIAWIDPAVLLVGHDKISVLIATTPALAPFRFHLTDIFRQATHTLSAEGEAVLAAAQLPLEGPANLNRILTGPELPPVRVVLSDGRPYDPAAKPFFSMSREDRKAVYDGSYSRYSALQETLGTNLTSSLQGDAFRAKARHFNSSLDQALSEPNIPTSVYRTLIAETNQGLPILHRYYALQSKAAAVKPMHFYDMGRPLASTDREFSLPDHFTITLDALSPLGEDYTAQLRKAFSNKWMDGLPRPSKLNVSVTAAGAYDVHPYLLLNLDQTYDSLTLFAHEWGHAMHNTLARESQPFETYYAPVFLQEIGSTCNEQLLISHLISTAQSKSERRFYLYQQMRVFATVFFQNALSAEFEATVHERIDSGASFSGADFTKLYLELMTRYYGPSVSIDSLYGIRWAQNEQLFSPFYQFQYCTSLTAAVYFSESILSGGNAERDNYLSVLKAGGAGYGYEILKSVGLDLSQPEPYRTLVNVFTRTVDEFESLGGA